MDKPVLLIMAAGLGSRYGGMKQIDSLDEQGHILMDFSAYDARQAGFETVVFVLRKEDEEAFRTKAGNRIAESMQTLYAFQDPDDLPEGFVRPERRVKPWGTAHAVWSARDLIHGPFAVINADDYYGKQAYQLIYDELSRSHEPAAGEPYDYAMVSYILGNTVTDQGYVSRGVCEVDDQGYLEKIVERTRIIRTENGTAFSEDGGETWQEISPQTPVSMNMWGFTGHFMSELGRLFPQFLEKGLKEDPMKCEYYLPFAVDELLKAGQARVHVQTTPDRWYGMTYKEDRDFVAASLGRMVEEGLYWKD